LLVPASAWAYRPFVSTDAAVADPKEIEIELGYFNLDRTNRENTISTSHVVLNYGVAKNLELVTEFSLQVSPEVEVIDPNVSLKASSRRGCFRTSRGSVSQWRPGRYFPRRCLGNTASDSRRSVS
jgi:hypothetical protein